MERSENKGLWASIVEWTGVLETARGNYEKAIAAFEQARSVFASIGEERGVALQDYHLGRTLDRSGEHRRAVDSLLRAADRIDPYSDGLTFGRILLRLGEAYRSNGDAEHANAALKRALEVMRRSDAPFYEAMAREALAQIAHDAGDAKTFFFNVSVSI